MTTAMPRPLLAPGEIRTYPVLPLRDTVVFPHVIAPLFVGRKKSILALEEVMRSDTFILLATQKNVSDDDPATEAIYDVGTLASVLQLLKLPDGTVKVLVEGAQRAKVVKYTDCSEYYEAEAVALGETMGERVEAKAFARSVMNEFESYVKLNKRVPPEGVGIVQQIEDYAKLADTVASRLALKIPDRQAILDHVGHRAAREGARPDRQRDFGAAGREAHPRARQAADGEDSTRVLPQRADEGDPERDRRRGRQGRVRRYRRQDQEDQALEGGAREGDARAQEAPADAADVDGIHCGAQLPRLAALDPAEDEKVEIARKHLILLGITKHGLDSKEWAIDDEALLTIIRRYTREAGVRNLERELSTLIRKAVKELLLSEKKSVKASADNLADYLGVPKYRYGEVEDKDQVGIVTGLAWTDVGGELLTIEAAMMPGKGRMTVTGNLRDVMKESISAAASYVRMRAVAFGIKPPLFDNRDIH